MLTSKFIKTDAVKITGNVFVFTLSLSLHLSLARPALISVLLSGRLLVFGFDSVLKRNEYFSRQRNEGFHLLCLCLFCCSHTDTRCRFRFNFQKTFFFVFISKSNHSWVRHSVEQSVHFLRPLNLHVLVSFGRQCLNIVAVLIQDSADSFLATGNAVPEEQPSSVWRQHVCLFCSLEDFTNIKTWK